MDEKDIFRKLAVGAKFDFRRFKSDAERLKVVKRRSCDIQPNYCHFTASNCKSTLPVSDCMSTMEASIVTLKQQLASGSIVAKFENLYKEKPGLTMNAAKLNSNKPKNRYIDILPYDATRVHLSGSDDYINASFVTMTPGKTGQQQRQRCSGRYVASQGPLPTTVADFWCMVWEQASSVIVMVTAEVEGRHVKCHRYWPSPEEKTVRHGPLSIQCTAQSVTQSAVFRTFELRRDETSAVRTIRHLQYIVWPDHGVPTDFRSFLDFINVVRDALSDSSTELRGPPVIHCSAGVGRTGVLIGLNTALCAMEAGQPIDVFDIVQRMRDQRGVMVQMTDQFKFLCEAVVKVYEERRNTNNSAVVRSRSSSSTATDESLSDNDDSNDDDDDDNDDDVNDDDDDDNGDSSTLDEESTDDSSAEENVSEDEAISDDCEGDGENELLTNAPEVSSTAVATLPGNDDQTLSAKKRKKKKVPTATLR